MITAIKCILGVAMMPGGVGLQVRLIWTRTGTRLSAIRRIEMSDAYIFRRTSRYPPKMLYHLGLITHDEYMELIGSEWYGWNFLLERDVLFYR